MEIIGRLTADATATTTANDKEVVNFRIAMNDGYRPKDGGDFVEIVTYVSCAYWRSTKVTAWLKKGVMVMLYGRIGVNAYNNSNGYAVGQLTFHVTDIKPLAFPKKENSNTADTVTAAPADLVQNAFTPDDLPF